MFMNLVLNLVLADSKNQNFNFKPRIQQLTLIRWSHPHCYQRNRDDLFSFYESWWSLNLLFYHHSYQESFVNGRGTRTTFSNTFHIGVLSTDSKLVSAKNE